MSAHGLAPTSPEVATPTVAAVVPTRGRPKLLREAVDSVLAQDYAGDIDLVVVHDQEEPPWGLQELGRPGRSITYAEDYEFLLRAVSTTGVGVGNRPLASVRKYNVSWFRDRGEAVATGLEHLLRRHPEIATSRRGHARVLGQIALAPSTMGQRRLATRTALRALSRWPVAPHAALALIHACIGVDPCVMLGVARRLGRGLT